MKEDRRFPEIVGIVSPGLLTIDDEKNVASLRIVHVAMLTDQAEGFAIGDALHVCRAYNFPEETTGEIT